GRRHYAVADPAVVGSRAEFWTSDPAYLLVHARRDTVVEPFATVPNQADYERDWSEGQQERAARRRAAWKSLPGIDALLAGRPRGEVLAAPAPPVARGPALLHAGVLGDLGSG